MVDLLQDWVHRLSLALSESGLSSFARPDSPFGFAQGRQGGWPCMFPLLFHNGGG
jgi:hypothetical protein